MTINVIPFSLHWQSMAEKDITYDHKSDAIFSMHWQSMAEKNITYDHKNDAIFNALAVGGGKGHNA